MALPGDKNPPKKVNKSELLQNSINKYIGFEKGRTGDGFMEKNFVKSSPFITSKEHSDFIKSDEYKAVPTNKKLDVIKSRYQKFLDDPNSVETLLNSPHSREPILANYNNALAENSSDKQIGQFLDYKKKVQYDNNNNISDPNNLKLDCHGSQCYDISKETGIPFSQLKSSLAIRKPGESESDFINSGDNRWKGEFNTLFNKKTASEITDPKQLQEDDYVQYFNPVTGYGHQVKVQAKIKTPKGYSYLMEGASPTHDKNTPSYNNDLTLTDAELANKKFVGARLNSNQIPLPVKKNGGSISELGYKDNSPYKNEKELDIHTPTGEITMKNVSKPLLGITPTGEQQLMLPGNEYKFKSKVVKEIPINSSNTPLMQMGGIMKEKKSKEELPKAGWGSLFKLGSKAASNAGKVEKGAGFLTKNADTINSVANVGASTLQGINANKAQNTDPTEQDALDYATPNKETQMASGAVDAGIGMLPVVGNIYAPAKKVIQGVAGAAMSPEESIKANGLDYTIKGAAIGTAIVPGWGTVIGAGVGFAADKIAGKRNFEKYTMKKNNSIQIRNSREDMSMRNNNGGSGEGDPMMKEGGIHINPNKEGVFTKKAKGKKMTAQQFADVVMSNKDNYSSETVKQANFAKNAKSFKHKDGGIVHAPELGGYFIKK